MVRYALLWVILGSYVITAQEPDQKGDQFFSSNGINIRYTVTGIGEPVILIHGFASSGDMWRTLVTVLSNRYQAIVMDCRGHGKSDKPHDPDQYGIEWSMMLFD